MEHNCPKCGLACQCSGVVDELFFGTPGSCEHCNTQAVSREKQSLMFDIQEDEANRKYTSKIETPVYEPRHAKPHVLLLWDDSKTKNLIKEIDASGLPEDEKRFLRAAAWRHAVFHYENIADYYAHSKPEMQRLMEKSALVIIDFEQAIELGFVRLCDEIRTQYLEEYSGDANPT